MTPWEQRAWVVVNHLPFLGPIRFFRLLERLHSIEPILDFSASDFVNVGVSQSLGETWAEALQDPVLLKRVDAEIDGWQKNKFQIVFFPEERYPTALKTIADAPPLLYVQGDLSITQAVCFGVVGTRHPSGYGEQVATRFAREMSACGWTTVSGLASGIDTVVHDISLKSCGKTVAVLGNGLGHTYPRSNQLLQRQVAEQGCVLSEFPFFMRPEASHFPRRNRIISGLSSGIVVIEAGQKSGALITASYAAEQGRDVYAVPGPIDNPMSAGCHFLLKQGAKPMESLADLQNQSFFPRSTPAGSIALPPLSQTEEVVFHTLAATPISIDRLSTRLKLPIEQICHALLSLELKELVKRYPGSRYGKIDT